MDFREAQKVKDRKAAKRAFDIIELARQVELSAEAAEALYDQAEGDLMRAVVMAKEKGLVPASTNPPPISAVGRREDSVINRDLGSVVLLIEPHGNESRWAVSVRVAGVTTVTYFHNKAFAEQYSAARRAR